jgi:acyl-CoA thioester hydrolase
MDAFGHVNNIVYFQYMEQARMEWLHALAPEYASLASEVGPVIVNASCTFFESLAHPGAFEVRLFAGEPGRSSFGTWYEVWMDGRKFAEGASRLVWVDRKAGKSMPLPERLAALLRTPADSP